MVASNAFEGLELIKHSLPDLVLSDISMPGRDGFGLLSDIRALGLDAGGAYKFHLLGFSIIEGRGTFERIKVIFVE